jgi:2-polyprenyl-6-methoxyphenol hydroxylase-like FAD-dependent oxidoreductase
MASTLIGKQAVVVGAGMSGLTAAGALAHGFDHVVVLARISHTNTLPTEPTYRAGTPQARHVHGLLLSGQRALSELFPGFEQDLARAGAAPLRVGLDVRVERPGYNPFPQRDLGWFTYAASRPTIERMVRQQIESCAKITLHQRCRVREVLACISQTMSASGARISESCCATTTFR